MKKFYRAFNISCLSVYPCLHKEIRGQYDCNHCDGKGQCYGFARKMLHEYYGDDIDIDEIPDPAELDNLSPGDCVRYKKSKKWHSIFVYAVNGDSVTYCDCNFSSPADCMIHWNQKTTIFQIKSRPFKHIERVKTKQ